MPRWTADEWSTLVRVPVRFSFVVLLALLFAASTLLHSGGGHAAFGDGDRFAAASLGDPHAIPIAAITPRIKTAWPSVASSALRFQQLSRGNCPRWCRSPSHCGAAT